MDKDSLKPVIESLIFASPGAISIQSLCSIIEGAERKAVREAVGELMEDYRARPGGILIEEVAGGYQFRTNPEYGPWVKRLYKVGAQRISRAAMEALAIIAYKQPVTRGELESIRGVDSGGVLATLMDKRLIKITGRKEAPGRPVVYGTTKEFLETFELKDLSSLPSLRELEELKEEYAAQEESEDTLAEDLPDRTEGRTEGRTGAGPEGGDEARAEERPEDGTEGLDEDVEGDAGDGPVGAGEGGREAEGETGEGPERAGGRGAAEGGAPGGREGEERAGEGDAEAGAEEDPEEEGEGGAAPEDNREGGGNVPA